MSLAPTSEELEALAQAKFDAGEVFSALRDALAAFFRENAEDHAFRVQLGQGWSRAASRSPARLALGGPM